MVTGRLLQRTYGNSEYHGAFGAQRSCYKGRTEAEIETKIETEIETDTETKIEAEIETDTETKIEAEIETDTETQIETEMETIKYSRGKQQNNLPVSTVVL